LAALSRTSRILPPGVAHSRKAALLVFAGLIAARSPLPYTAVALIPLAWAGVELVLSIRDRTATSAPSLPPTGAEAQAVARARAPGIASSIIGLLLVFVLTVTVVLPYAFYGTVKSLQDCAQGANTAIANKDCNARYNSDLDPAVRGFLRIGQPAGG
jgi:hypothetical protein